MQSSAKNNVFLIGDSFADNVLSKFELGSKHHAIAYDVPISLTLSAKQKTFINDSQHAARVIARSRLQPKMSRFGINKLTYMNKLIESLVRFIYPFGKKRTVLRGPIRGYKYVVQPGMGFTYALGADTSNIAFLSEHIHTGSVVYDIGANRGQTVLPLSDLAGREGKVMAFEPVSDLCQIIEQNCKINELQNVKIIECAVSDKEGSARFAYSEEHSTQGTIDGAETRYQIGGTRTLNVKTVSLDKQIEAGMPAPDLMKIDVEGAATLVFRGAKKLLEKQGPDIYLELHGPEEQAGVRDELMARGYIVETIDGMKIADPTSGWYSPLWCYKK